MQSRYQFLTEEQRECLTNSILAILARLKQLPAHTLLILTECEKEDLHYLTEIDPSGSILRERLIKLNEDALYKQFHEVGDTLTRLITDNMAAFESEHSLMFLREPISKEVNRACSSTNFELRLQQTWSNAGSTLWETMHDQLAEIAMGITGFMHSHLEMAISAQRRELEVSCFLQSFRQRFQGKQKLNKIYVVKQKLEHEMLQFKNESKIIDYDNQQDEWSGVMGQIENIEKVEEETIQVEEVVRAEGQKEQQKQGSGKGKNFGGIVKGKLANTFKNVKALISKSSPYEQKSIEAIELEQNLEDYLENLTHFEISEARKGQIQAMASMELGELEELLHGEFDEKQLSIIQFAIRNPMEKWYQHQSAMGSENELYTQSISALSAYSSQLNSPLHRLASGVKRSEMGEYLLTALFYRLLEREYCPFAKRYLMKVLRIIESELERNSKAYLRGALRILQTNSIHPTKTAALLCQQRPSRSKEYQQSYQSMIYLQNNHFEDEASLREVQKTLQQIKKQQVLKEDIPKMSFLRLGLSPSSKTVTILISGFLSEDSSKDLQWMGMIRALQDTQLYSLSWRSSTLKETGLYVANLAADLILNPLSLSGSGAGLALNALRLSHRVVDLYKNNPFAAAHIRAQAVGTYLAEFIIKSFPDRFVNLVGFSLGTEVVLHCLQRLAVRKRMDLINRIVMLGGAADRQQTKRLLQSVPTSLELLNLWSKGDCSIRYIYRLCKLGSIAIGADNIGQMNGHDIVNINCSRFVKSHMDFRCNLYGIALISGLVHD